LSTPFENVKNWILNSGLVITNEQNENSGGVHSFFDHNNQKYGFLYPEITGYSVSAFCFLHQIENEEKYVKLAKTSSDWLIGLIEKFMNKIGYHHPDSTYYKIIHNKFSRFVKTSIYLWRVHGMNFLLTAIKTKIKRTILKSPRLQE